jgi:hypothetical protein
MHAKINYLLHGSLKQSLPAENNRLLILGKEQDQGEAGEERVACVLVPIQVLHVDLRRRKTRRTRRGVNSW